MKRTQTGNGRIVARTFVLGLLVLSSCATPQPTVEPWVVNGQRVGNITTSPRPWGFEFFYSDFSGHVLRKEKRSEMGGLRPGACITTYSYSAEGNVAEEKILDGSEHLTVGPEQYAVHRWAYSRDRENNSVIEETFLDTELRPVATTFGFSILRRTETGGRPVRLHFFDAAHRPAPTVWLGVPNVVEAQYVYLQGVTEVTCVVLLDAAGNVVSRQEISGLTKDSWTE